MAHIGNYRVGKQIGEGGFARVYEGIHLILDEKVCLKQNKVAGAEYAELLEHEAKMLWKLDGFHSIPSVRDFYRPERDTGVMVVSHIEGKTLEEIMEGKFALQTEDACWIMERLLEALHFAHAYGIVHSDVKPQNVFVEPEKSDIKLIDFGLAVYKPSRHARASGYTPGYAAPELQNGFPPIPETDIYGAGMVMLRALGGDLEKKEFPAHVPEKLKEFCSSLIQYDPRERPNWEKGNPLERLSEIRQEVFGRRHRR